MRQARIAWNGAEGWETGLDSANIQHEKTPSDRKNQRTRPLLAPISQRPARPSGETYATAAPRPSTTLNAAQTRNRWGGRLPLGEAGALWGNNLRTKTSPRIEFVAVCSKHSFP